jgi:tetratricopeptide (TPR) repeat protein
MLLNLRDMLYQQEFDVLAPAARLYFLEAGDVQALPLQAVAHANLGERDEALAVLEQAQERQYELTFESQAEMGAAWLALGQAARADLWLQTAARQMPWQCPQQAYAHAQLALLAQKKGRLDEALEGYRQAFALMPGLVMVWFNLVRLLLDMQLGAEAQEVIDHATASFHEIEQHLDKPVRQRHRAALEQLQQEIWQQTGKQPDLSGWMRRSMALH